MWEQIFKTAAVGESSVQYTLWAYVTPNITLFWVPVRTPGTFQDISVHGEWRGFESRLLSVQCQTDISDDLTILEALHPERNDEYPDLVKR